MLVESRRIAKKCAWYVPLLKFNTFPACIFTTLCGQFYTLDRFGLKNIIKDKQLQVLSTTVYFKLTTEHIFAIKIKLY